MESVEELCDHIALLNKSHKILDGSVKSIKNAYRNSTYHISVSPDFKISTSSTFELMNVVSLDEHQKLTIKLKNGFNTNDVLQELIPFTNVSYLEEVVPTINEIFIEKVKELN